MDPDFKKKTVETLAKRSAFLCSNPDCRTQTIGPNSEPDKATNIGEAAHIRGARPDSKRYVPTMPDLSLYLHEIKHISVSEVPDWASNHLSEMSVLASPFEGIIEKLNTSWGAAGTAGDANEILHTCLLLRDHLKQVVSYEEKLAFAKLPSEYERFQKLMKDSLGLSVEKIAEFPDYFNYVLATIDSDHGGTPKNPTRFEKTITFDVPEDWGDEVVKEYKRAYNKVNTSSPSGGSGCNATILIAVFLVIVLHFYYGRGCTGESVAV